MADIDNEGDGDIVIWKCNEPLTVLRNDRCAGNCARHCALCGQKQTQEVLSQASFHSSNGPTLYFGLVPQLPIRRFAGRQDRNSQAGFRASALA